MSRMLATATWTILVPAPQQYLKETLPKTLRSRWNLKQIDAHDEVYVFAGKRPSIIQNFLKPNPCQVTWCLLEKDCSSTILTLSFDFSPRLLFYIYLLAALTGIVTYLLAVQLMDFEACTFIPRGLLYTAYLFTLMLPTIFFGFRTAFVLCFPWSVISSFLKANHKLIMTPSAAPLITLRNVLDGPSPSAFIFSLLHAFIIIIICILPYMINVADSALFDSIALPLIIIYSICIFPIIACAALLVITDNLRLNSMQLVPLVASGVSSGLLSIYFITASLCIISIVPSLYIIWNIAISQEPPYFYKIFNLNCYLMPVGKLSQALYFTIFNIATISSIACLVLYFLKKFSWLYYSKDYHDWASYYNYMKILISDNREAERATTLLPHHKIAAIIIVVLSFVINLFLLALSLVIALDLVRTRSEWPLSTLSILFVPFCAVTGIPQEFSFTDLLGCGELCVLTLVFLITAPILLILIGNIHWWLSSLIHYNSLTPVSGILASVANEVSKDMNVEAPYVYIDPYFYGMHIRSEMRGIRRKRIIRMSKGVAMVLEIQRTHAYPVFMHEMMHLKYDTRRIWWLRVLSRIMLTGAGTLSFLIDSVEMERRAYDETKEYLNTHGKSGNLLDEAIELFLYHEKIRHKKERDKRVSLCQHIRNVYRLYFFEEELFYFHPPYTRQISQNEY